MRVAIRADASYALGTGHIARTLALASALRDFGAQVWFLSRTRPGHLHQLIKERRFNIAPLSAVGDCGDWLGIDYAAETQDSAGALAALGGVSLLIVDQYGIDEVWETAMRRFCDHIMVIDDLANRAHDCDILLDQNANSRGLTRYAPFVSGAARVLIGPQYALLREEFRPYASMPPFRSGEASRILVSLGGFDRDGYTLKAVQGIVACGRPVSVDVIGASDVPGAEELRRMCDKHGYRFFGRVADVAQRMAAADIAIGAMGSSAWERCLMGLPTLALTMAENQRGSAFACHQAGAVRWLGDAGEVSAVEIGSALCDLLDDAATRSSMSTAARALVGAGTQFSTDRVVSELRDLCRV